jgi:hypothetical protein
MLLPVLRQIADPVTKTEIVRLIVVLAFRWVVAGRNAQKLEDFFQDQCSRAPDQDFPEILKKHLSDQIASFQVDAQTHFFQEAGNSYVVRALLYAVDKHLRGGANPLALDPSAIHVEHIAPQKPTDHWSAAMELGDDTEAYRLMVNLPGNLTLLDQKLNIQAQRKPFVDKRDFYYHKSNVILTRDLSKFSDWNPEHIRLRTEWLAEMFDLVWSLDEGKVNGVTPFSAWFANRK